VSALVSPHTVRQTIVMVVGVPCSLSIAPPHGNRSCNMDAGRADASSLIAGPAISSSFCAFSSGIDSLLATSSAVGSRPISFNIWRDVRTTLLTPSIEVRSDLTRSS
jgi:hypothetical protein